SIDGGLEYVTSWADWSNSGNIYLSEFKSLRIPVGINTRLNFSNSDEPENTFPKISVLVGIGLYGNYLMKYEIEDFAEDTDIGWNLGSYGKLGINFNVNSTLTLGMGFKTDLDFSEIEKEQN